MRRLVLFALLASLPAAGQTVPPATPPPKVKSKVTIDALMAQQQELMNELVQQRTILLQLLEAERAKAEGRPVALTPLPSFKEPEPPEGTEVAGRTTPGATPPKRKAVPTGPSAPVSGQVNVKGGKPSDVFVYVEDVRAPLAKGTFQIQQKDKQFQPRVAVVQRGTTLVFPNYDAVFHNVFSVSPGNNFDLGTYQAGEPARSAVMTTPGVVDVFCNLHSRMSASVLVVPSALFARASADGKFRIENVPVGTHRLVAWTPNGAPAMQQVEVGTGGAEASFSIEVAEKATHTNKYGQPYGSYGD
jgi:plastocyanin